MSYKILKKYIITYNSDTKSAWDIFVVVLAIYSGFIIPLDFAFKPYFT